MDFIHNFFEQLWILSIDAAPFLFIGFVIGALLHAFLPAESLLRLLGKGRFRPTLVAALVGIPLPLCSCSVVPTALALRRKGASSGATLSFFIATPETGVDSILLTYGMMGPLGPVMAVARPLAAGLSAILAGFSLDSFTPPSTRDHPPSASPPPTCCEESTSEPRGAAPTFPLFKKWANSFLMLLDDIAVLVALGLVFSAVVGALVPEDFGLSARLGSSVLEMGMAILVGLPLYVCATASTPLAAVLIAKGLSPGAALVFLLVGPATNIGTIALVQKHLGIRAVFTYLTSIVGVSVLIGLVVNLFCQEMRLDISGISHSHGTWGMDGLWVFLLWFLIIWRIWVRIQKKKAAKNLRSGKLCR